MQSLVRLAGYVALVLTPAALVTRAFAANGASTGALGLGGVALAGGVVVASEREHAFGTLDGAAFDRADAADALAVAAGAVATHLLNVHGSLGPVLASAAAGLAVGVLAEELAVPAYCGSFVGMASPAVFPSVEYLAVAGLCTGLAFAAAERAFAGFGGKLGTLALFGCATTVALTGADYAAGNPLPWASAGVVVPVTVAAAVATAALSQRAGLGPVVGSALVGLAAGAGLPLVASPEGTLAAAAFCASFVGMSSTDRLDAGGIAAAGAVCGVVFVAVSPAFVGAGGKLGTVAFLSCAAVAGLERSLAALTSGRDAD